MRAVQGAAAVQDGMMIACDAHVGVGRSSERQDVANPDGSPGRVQRSIVLGLVSVVPSKYEAQLAPEDRLRDSN